MPTYNSASTDLASIQQMIRRLTRSPSDAQITDADINQYINTFIEQDLPSSVKLFSLRTLLTFYTQPGVDVYGTSTDPNNPLYNFKNKYTAIHEPIYIAGVLCYVTQDRDVFYGNWPQTNTIQNTGQFGNGGTGPFTGIIQTFQGNPTPVSSRPFIQQSSVIFSALDIFGTAMTLVDVPISNIFGSFRLPNLDNPSISYGTINYITGQYSVTFPNNTLISSASLPNPIISEYIAYAPGIPTTVLYYNNQFTLRPIPNQAYAVQVEANIIPTDLIASGDNPQISQWWQYIAYGAAIKILQQRTDFETAQAHMPEFQRQESFVLSTSMEQYANQRSVTIYTNNGEWNAWNNFGRWPY